MTDEPQHGHFDDDLWSWIGQEESDEELPEIDPASVTAVMVVCGADEWLPRQLLSLAGLAPRPGRLVVIDAGSSAEARALLVRALDEGVFDELIEGEGTSFGAAVNLALGDAEPEWIWLLHDDSAPRRDTLAHLLDGARRADVVVPKLLEPKRRNYPETISEAGQAITAGGIRVPLVEEGDVDQGQTEARDVLGASTAGLLVRGDTWRELGGLAPEVPRHRDGVDLGWRANAHGFRVLTWPAASLHHLRAGRTGARAAGDHPHVADRLAALRIAGSRGASGFGLGAATLARTVGFLFAKAPGHAKAELSAWRRYRATPEETAALRARLPAEDMTPDDLLPSRFWPVRHAVDRFGAGIAERYRGLSESSVDTSIDELTSDEFGATAPRATISPVTILVVGLIVACLVAGRTLLGAGPVSGGGLLAAPPSLGAAWQAYLTGSAPWLGFSAAASLLGLGSPGWFAFLALVLVPVLAGLSALALLRRLRVRASVAAAASAAWAAGTVLLGVVSAGDVSGMILATAGPLLVRSIHSVMVNDAGGAERLRAPAGAAFWLLVTASAWPVLLLGATVAAVILAVRRRSRAVEAALVVAPVWLFFVPWLPTLARDPGRLLTGADPLAWPDYPPASYAVLLGRILPSGLPVWANAAFFAVVGLVSLLAIAGLRRRDWLLSFGWIGAPLVTGIVLSRLVVPVDGSVVRPLLSPWALLVLAALLAPVVRRANDGTFLRGRATVALGLVAALTFGVWGWVGFAGPVRSTPSVLPGYVRDVLRSPRDTRAMLIDLSVPQRVTWSVVDARQPQWGTGERNPVGSFAPHLGAVAEAIASGNPPGDLAERFRAMGVSHLWVRGLDAERQAALDNLESMVPAPADDQTTVWTVSGLVSRVTTTAGDPVATGTVPAGAGGLVLADAAGAAWTATLDGRALPRAADVPVPLLGGETVVAFGPIPAGGGVLSVQPAERWGQSAWHAVLLAALVTLAAPTLGGAAVARRGHE
ncbi:MAG: glycosyltransferase family 2 protein [Tessaracoccus sp.]|uniref:glycosyltransferase n=1 Tax=Tessaracoccus sp. TaxID=1971211 RepID=UPI001ED5E8E5|nr:glycosyltransferase [Tessaracoccus sp.]MBK7821628.1 glycosyltransferase family 2 protein [Tessaracoccus sp.]